MSTQTVFNSEDQSEETKEEPKVENIENYADQLSQILNDKGEPKYKDVQTALEALKSSQEYIPSLKQEKETLAQELERLKEELTRHSKLDEVFDKLQQPPAQEENPIVEQEKSSALTQEQVQEMLEQFVPQLLEKRQSESTQQKNIQTVDQKLKEFYGDKVEDAVRTKAESLGLSIQDLEALSAKSPNSALELLGVKEIKPTGRTLSSSVSLPLTSSSAPNLKPEKSMLKGATSREQSEYLRLLKENVLKRNGFST